MNSHRSADRLRGAASLVATALLLFGVPLGLVVFVGWPLPTSVPSTESLTQGINTGISDVFIVKALALIAWVAWAQIALALLVEATAAVRGRQSTALPLAPGFQVAAARLIAGIVMLLGPLQPVRAVAATPSRPPAIESVQFSAVPVDSPDLGEHMAPSNRRPIEGTAPTAPARTIAVERHETYWSIAERELGDGLRWQELHAANLGRTMADGTVILAGDQTLRAGWTLEVPGAVETSVSASKPAEIVVADGDNLWDLSAERLGADLGHRPSDAQTAPYWSEVIETNSGRLADPADPSLIYPGQVLAMPATGVAAPAPPIAPKAPDNQVQTEETPSTPAPTERLAPDEEPTPSAPATPAPSAETTTTEAPQPESASPANRDADEHAPKSTVTMDDGASFPWMLAGGGLGSIALALGAKRLIERRRRAYVSDHDAVDLPPPDPEQRSLFQEVVAAADEDRIGELQRALGELSNAFAEGGEEARPRLVRHEEGSLEVLLDRPTSVAPTGWTSDGEGLILTLSREIDPEADFDGPSSPAPLMVTIGQPDEGAHLYLDLEATGVLALVGDVEAARRLARSMLTELALSPLADGNRVITIGDLVASEAAGLPQLTCKETWHDVAEDLQAWVDASHDALTTSDWPNTFVARGHDPDHEALMPMVIVATKPPPPEILDRLIDLRPSAVAIVVADEMDGALTVIECEPDEIRFKDVDLVFSPQQVNESELEDLGRLFVLPDLNLGDTDVREGLELDDAQPHTPSPAGAPPQYEILVRCLGDIRVEGGSKTLHPKPTAVTAYLALNRSVTSERLEEACWFGSDGMSHRKRLRETMTVCRDAIGSQHLPPNKQGMYTIGPGVRTDIDLFEWHVRCAVDAALPDAIEHYCAALDLVTGRPFSYANKARMSFGWVDFEHHATTWEMRIAGVAKAFTELCIDAGDPGRAIGTLRRLLQAAPLNGGVVAALMRAHIESGDRLAADHVYEEHITALDRADLGDPDDEIEQLRLDLRLG